MVGTEADPTTSDILRFGGLLNQLINQSTNPLRLKNDDKIKKSGSIGNYTNLQSRVDSEGGHPGIRQAAGAETVANSQDGIN